MIGKQKRLIDTRSKKRGFLKKSKKKAKKTTFSKINIQAMQKYNFNAS